MTIYDSDACVEAALAGIGWFSFPNSSNRHLSAAVRVFVEWASELFANAPLASSTDPFR